MEAIVLAGGFGTRLKSVVPDLPKPMAPVAGRPFLEILLSDLARKGFTRVILSLGYMAELIVEYFGNEFKGMELVHEIEDRPLGTGGAVKMAMQHCRGDHVFVFNGDTYLDLEATEVERQFNNNHNSIIVARKVENTARYGRLLQNSSQVGGFTEKGVSGPGFINAGVYVLSTSSLVDYETGTPFSLESDYFANAVDSQYIEMFITNGYFIDIGVPEDYAIAQETLKDALT